MNFFIKRNETVNGPFTGAQIKAGFKEGKLKDTDLMSSSKDGPWEPIRQTPVKPEANAAQQGVPTQTPDGIETPPSEEIESTPVASAAQSPPDLVTATKSTGKKKFILIGSIVGGAVLLMAVVAVSFYLFSSDSGGDTRVGFKGPQIYEKFQELLEAGREQKEVLAASKQFRSSGDAIRDTERLLTSQERLAQSMERLHSVRQELQTLMDSVDIKDWDKPLMEETKITVRDLYQSNKDALAKYDNSSAAVSSPNRNLTARNDEKTKPSPVVNMKPDPAKNEVLCKKIGERIFDAVKSQDESALRSCFPSDSDLVRWSDDSPELFKGLEKDEFTSLRKQWRDEGDEVSRETIKEFRSGVSVDGKKVGEWEDAEFATAITSSFEIREGIPGSGGLAIVFRLSTKTYELRRKGYGDDLTMLMVDGKWYLCGDVGFRVYSIKN
jgi:hypothetical protein